jgi:YidC/Oxa1 family membrane protein insertase
MLAAREQRPLLSFQVLSGRDTIALDTLTFTRAANDTGTAAHAVSYHATLADGRGIDVKYLVPTSAADRYLSHVVVTVSGGAGASALLVRLPRTLQSQEADTADDIRHLAVGYKPDGKDVESVAFSKLDSGQTRIVEGPHEWVAMRDKYFLVAILGRGRGIAALRMVGEPRQNKLAIAASAEAVLPLDQGSAAFDLYTGPQEFERLRALGHNLDEVNPYSSFLRVVVQPFSTLMTRVLLWMKRTSGLSYGWVIVILGVGIRLLLWPLNQSAMRTSIRMQRIQPELAAVQAKYRNDPEKQRDALVKLYQAHGMTPFSPMMGCLPMLIPMPILFALYYVFANTIAFRGVSFLWLPDISAADPYFIIPLVMGVTMFALSWIGMRGTPPTPQTRMMSYMMPVIFTVMFFRLASGLNLYYAVQNLAALPQQWMLARERVQAGVVRAGPPPGKNG